MRAFFAAIALVAGIITPAASASGVVAGYDGNGQRGLGIRLVDVPVATPDDPRARVYIIDHVAPGSLVERRIGVSNRTGAAAQVSVYPAAADISKGGFTGAEGRTANELSTWTTVNHGALRLADGAKSLVTVKIDVPSDAAPGERYAALWAQMTMDAPSGGGVTQVSRVGIRIYLSVGPGNAPASDFEIESLTSSRAANGTAVVQAKVHNTGGRALDLRGTLRLNDGPGGLSRPVSRHLGNNSRYRPDRAGHCDARQAAARRTLEGTHGAHQRAASSSSSGCWYGAGGTVAKRRHVARPWQVLRRVSSAAPINWHSCCDSRFEVPNS